MTVRNSEQVVSHGLSVVVKLDTSGRARIQISPFSLRLKYKGCFSSTNYLLDQDLHASWVNRAVIHDVRISSCNIIRSPEISIWAKTHVEVAGRSTTATILLSSLELAIRHASESLTLLPEVLWWADLLGLRHSEVALDWLVALLSGVHDGHGHVGARTIDCGYVRPVLGGRR